MQPMDDKTIRLVTTQKVPQTPASPSGSMGDTRGGSTLKPAMHSAADSTLDSTRVASSPTQLGEEPQGEQIMLRGKPFMVKSCLSDNSGEAQVFLGTYEGEERVLKVYYPNFTVNRNLLKVVANMSFEMIVKLFDFGKTYVDGKNRDYELMEYLPGGTMAGFRVQGNMNLFRRIALQCAAALAYCHNNRLIHKDIKPGNIFFRDKAQTQIAIADFGISAVMSADEVCIRTTQARTPIYAAPEMYTDVIDGEVEISPAADYYSLGMTLLAIWTGEKPLNANERSMMKLKNEGRIPGVQDLPERVRMIVQGLTAVDASKRWAYEQVEKWFLGESPDIDLSSPWLKYKSFVVDPERNLVADNIHDLIPMLLDNEPIARNYLYSGRIVNWLEMSGNTKLSIALKDIVKNRYPLDQEAGLMAAIYTMEPTYPYCDMHGNRCDDTQGIVSLLMQYADEYAIRLKNTNDMLWLYLESHTKANVNRMRSYFSKPSADLKIAVARCVYELDTDLPFLPKYPTSTLQEIVSTFGSAQLTEDAWHSLCDGRLLSWMYGRIDPIICESIHLLIENQEYSKTLAYKVLYNLDKGAAYDLCEADTPEKVGDLLCDIMKRCQHVSEEEFARQIEDFSNPQGRFHYYAQLHGWSKQLSLIDRSFDLKSDENRDRYSAYDLYTAAYRTCRILGSVPQYVMPCGDLLKDGLQIASKYRSEIRTELNKGIFAQWLSVFYHENPDADFSEPYSYERELVKWIEALGLFNAQHVYFHRYQMARDATKKKYDEVKSTVRRAQASIRIWVVLFYLLSISWLFLIIRYGISNPEYLLHNAVTTIMLPVGGATAAIMAVRSFFKGAGIIVILLQALVGFFSSLIPMLALKWTYAQFPAALVPLIVVLSLVYMAIAVMTDYRRERKSDMMLVKKVVEDDEKTDLLEPLYYTFKTKSFRFKGSKFSALDGVQDNLQSITSETILHHLFWCLMIGLLVFEILAFHPDLMNLANPDIDIWNIDATGLYKEKYTNPQ